MVKKNKKKIVIIFLFILGICLVTIGTIYFIKRNNAIKQEQLEQEKIKNTIVSTLTIDVNPSIEINLNKDNLVVLVKGLNEESINLLNNQDFKYQKLEKVFDNLVKLLKDNKYLESDTNTILVNVTSEDKNVESLVKENLEKVTKENNISTEIIILALEETEELKKIAEENNITIGKAYYIEEQLKNQEGLTIEDLKDTSINEIKNKIEDVKTQLEQEKLKKEEEEKTNTNVNNNGGSSSSCTPPSNLKDPSWCSFNVSRPQWCEYYYSEKMNQYTNSQKQLQRLGIGEFGTIGRYATEKQDSRSSYCLAYKDVITTREYRYTILSDSVTGELIEETYEKVPTFVDENIVKQHSLNYFNLQEEDCRMVWVSLSTEAEGGPNWYYRYQVNIDLPDGTIHTVNYNAITGNLVNVFR